MKTIIKFTDEDRQLAKQHTRKGFKGRKKFKDVNRQSYFPNLSEIAVAKYYGVDWKPVDAVRGPDVNLPDGTGVQVKCVLSSDYYKKYVGYELLKWQWEQDRGCDRVVFVSVDEKKAEILSIMDYNTVRELCEPMSTRMAGDSRNINADWTGIPKDKLKQTGIQEEYLNEQVSSSY